MIKCPRCGADMLRRRTPEPGEVWLRCANPRCGWEEFEYPEKETAEKKLPEKKRVEFESAGQVLCPRCGARTQPVGSLRMCPKCGKMIKR